MPKRTEDEIYHWLWFEALKLNDEYIEVCQWVKNSDRPPEELDWSQYSHIEKTYAIMGNVFFNLFDEWWKKRAKPLNNVTAELYSHIQVCPIDLCEGVEEGLKLFENDFSKDFNNAKTKLLAWITEQFQRPDDLIIKINTGLVENAKEVMPEIKDLIVGHRGKNSANRRLRAAEIALYLSAFRESLGKAPISLDGWPKKDIGYLEDSDRFRMIRKAKKIIKNAASGDFPGDY